jgi:hypothetical protein
MASIQEIINQVDFIKQKSDDLESTIRQDSEELRQTGSRIATIIEGSNMGTEAVQAVSVALRSLSFAEASIRTLSKGCDTYIEKLTQ